ncbi:MAG: aminotransferase class IV [Polyangiales bacterium]|nr:aminotransferase class IV [Myxococcales bacterium]MCB9659117.1 aminotransferase class IV [Sandaracinaceae bacterium]
MPTVVSINGEIFAESDAKVSVFDRGFLYGDSVFEVYRTYDGVPFAELEHLERLARSAQRLLIALPVSIDQLRDEVARAHVASGNSDSYVRVVITRGSGPLTYDLTTAKEPTRVIIAAPVPTVPAAHYTHGVSVRVAQVSRPTDDPQAAGVKASNYLANLLAVHAAKQQGAHEAIITGRGGEVLEGASSNVFVVTGGRLRTPRPEAGILDGITRRTVLEAARRVGLPVDEEALFPADLYAADEVFITSSIREVVPVVQVDDRRIADGRPGPVVAQLHAAYREVVRAQTRREETGA